MPEIPIAEVIEASGGIDVDLTESMTEVVAEATGQTEGSTFHPVEGINIEVDPSVIVNANPTFGAGGFFGGGASGASGDSADVDTGAIRSAAERGTAHVNTIDQLIQEMQQEMVSSEGVWMGEAGAWYRDAFAIGSAKCRKGLEEFAVFTNELVSYADEYEQVDSRAQKIADSAEQPSV